MSATTTSPSATGSALPNLGSGRFYGKYRGTVLDNVDSEMRFRILAMVPDVSGPLPTSWALPCFPWGGIQTGVVCVPPIGAGVWIEFEQGDPDYPIWTGCYFGSAAEVPAAALLYPPPVPAITLQTPLQNSLTVSDLPGPTGGIMLKSMTGATITINETGIILQNGQGASIMMTGPSVIINEGAIAVT